MNNELQEVRANPSMQHSSPTSSKRGVIDDVVKFALIALIIVVPIRWFVAQPFIVRGDSMVPTFKNGEYLIVDQLTYRFEEPERGDVIIMRYPKDPSVYFIKRIIGLPGETIELQGKKIVVRKVDGEEPIVLNESFISSNRARDEFGVYKLYDHEYFVMGDNRNESSDSRSWGSLPERDVIGRAFLRLYPFTRINFMPGETDLAQ